MFKNLEIAALFTIAIALVGVNGHALSDTLTPPVLTKETRFQQNHPRRAQVNSRLNTQNKRIDADVKNGSMSRKQAAALHKDDHQIRSEERDMADQNDTNITKTEQKTLNQQENTLSGEIHK